MRHAAGMYVYFTPASGKDTIYMSVLGMTFGANFEKLKQWLVFRKI
jgi:hypothetical protein